MWYSVGSLEQGVIVIHDGALLLTLAVLWIIPAVLVARMAERRGYSFSLFLIAALVIPWPAILIVGFALPRRNNGEG